ncbi:Peroxisomal membrane protein PMP22 [Triticum urartu]|uniref:Peroxisomal membrane protein PMP22 n=1 Tax=Triticum urartu TaxID=4572 RepID=M7YVQ9_TRIUA|nr:Peroxisomal membrane protein PMP22 [Triticum urartu]
MAGQAYMRQLSKHPLRTKAITSGVLAGCSDAVAQKISGVKKLQLRRLLLIMVIVEQLTVSPWNNMMFMMYYGLVVEGRPFGQVKSKVKKDFANIQLTAWKFWPIVSWINYEYMPLQLRVLFASSVASCWAVFLNLKAARSIAGASKNA